MQRRTIAMRFILATGLLPALIVVVQLPVALARSKRPPCDKIRAAVAAGRSMDQIIAEFDTDAEQVTKCLQKRARRRKSAAGKRTPTQTKKHSEHPTSDLKRQGHETSEESKPPTEPPRPRLPPSHPFGPRSVP